MKKERKGTCPNCKEEIEYLDFVETNVGECYPTENSLEWDSEDQYSKIEYKCPLCHETIFTYATNHEIDEFFQ